MAEVLARTVESSREVADALVQLALDNGAPDTVTVIIIELGNRPLDPLLAIIAGASMLAYSWTQQQYFVGTYEDQVAIYQGVKATLGPFELSTMIEETGISVDELPAYQHMQVTSTIPFSSLDEARALVERLEDAVNN